MKARSMGSGRRTSFVSVKFRVGNKGLMDTVCQDCGFIVSYGKYCARCSFKERFAKS